MFFTYKYKNNIYINNNYLVNFVEDCVKLNNNSFNYVYNYKRNILRNFIYIYSIFLIFSPFSIFQLNNNLEFKKAFSINTLLVLEENYNEFFTN